MMMMMMMMMMMICGVTKGARKRWTGVVTVNACTSVENGEYLDATRVSPQSYLEMHRQSPIKAH